MKKVRNLQEDDREMLERWIADDPHHGHVDAGFFYEPQTEGFVFEDESGPVLILRVARSLRLDMQFQQGQAARTAKVLKWGGDWLAEKARKAGFLEMVFESKFPPLKRFCTRKLGFAEKEGDCVRDLAR